MKTLGAKFILISVIAGLLLPCLFMPKFIVWYGDPVVPTGFTCGPTASWAVHRFIAAQLACGSLFLILAVIFKFKFAKSTPSKD